MFDRSCFHLKVYILTYANLHNALDSSPPVPFPLLPRFPSPRSIPPPRLFLHWLYSLFTAPSRITATVTIVTIATVTLLTMS